MSRRDFFQPAFADAMVIGYGRARVSGPDRGIRRAGIRGSAGLDPRFGQRGSWRPTLTMLKIPPLYQWHTLSDLGAEEMVRDRPSFRRFYGLPLSSSKPKILKVRSLWPSCRSVFP